MNNKSSLLFTFILGAAAGAVVAYLLGSGKADHLKEDLKETADKLKDELDKQVSKGKEFIDDLTDKANQSFKQS